VINRRSPFQRFFAGLRWQRLRFLSSHSNRQNPEPLISPKTSRPMAAQPFKGLLFTAILIAAIASRFLKNN
jgi:hypothetical protein